MSFTRGSHVRRERRWRRPPRARRRPTAARAVADEVAVDADRCDAGGRRIGGVGPKRLGAQRRTLPGVSMPSRVVRSTMPMAVSIAHALASFLMERVPSAGGPRLRADLVDSGQAVQEPSQRCRARFGQRVGEVHPPTLATARRRQPMDFQLGRAACARRLARPPRLRPARRLQVALHLRLGAARPDDDAGPGRQREPQPVGGGKRRSPHLEVVERTRRRSRRRPSGDPRAGPPSPSRCGTGRSLAPRPARSRARRTRRRGRRAPAAGRRSSP